MLYYAIKETEEARELTREFIKEYYEQLEEQKKQKTILKTYQIAFKRKLIRKVTKWFNYRGTYMTVYRHLCVSYNCYPLVLMFSQHKTTLQYNPR